ncbi:MAG: FAD-dependent oxidoreductase [Boseongicola sp.]|nr:FAD-dependent oxidoreductase [Boseongicola sp.]
MIEDRYSTASTLYPYCRVSDQDAEPRRHPVVIVGAGPVGLALALDLGQRGTPTLVLDDHEGPGAGSKAICFAKRTLDIAHRLGAAKKMVEKGVVWNVGRVFYGGEQLFEFNLLPESGHRHPAFINLQQPYFEQYLIECIRVEQSKGTPIEIRGRNQVTALTDKGDFVALEVDTPEGTYKIEAEFVVACDGARSPTRDMMGLSFDGRVFEDNFLIADVRMEAELPTERWFWFHPTFAPNVQSTLLHKQPDDIWRIDFQLGWDIDRDKELDPSRICSRVDALLSSQTGDVPDYELHWTSIYTFQCRRMQEFRKGRIFFAGDSAHQVSPFGARGANSGVQDAENLAWKLDLVLKGLAPSALLDSYSSERTFGADENILNSSRATDFMTPKSKAATIFRDAALDLARDHAFARTIINSGRLSVPCVYDGHAHFVQDALTNGPEVTRPGAPCPDAPVEGGFLLDNLKGNFTVLAIGFDCSKLKLIDGVAVDVLCIHKPSEYLQERYLGGGKSAVYLIRPDQHVVGRWPEFSEDKIRAALLTALGKEPI